MLSIDVHQIPCLENNYGYLVHVPATGLTAAIDTPDAAAIEIALEQKEWRLTHILNTHWHDDHTGGNLVLKEKFGVTVIGPALESNRIPGIDRVVGEGDRVELGGVVAQVIAVPGHTSGHIAYWFEDAEVLFSGDALFPLGCGRIFEGSHEEMWQSLVKLRALPQTTLIYCGHEYTAGNAAFAATIDPDNAALRERIAEIDALRASGLPTVPSTLELECRTNPFLRVEDAAIRGGLGMTGRSDVAVFAEIRTRKDSF